MVCIGIYVSYVFSILYDGRFLIEKDGEIIARRQTLCEEEYYLYSKRGIWEKISTSHMNAEYKGGVLTRVYVYNKDAVVKQNSIWYVADGVRDQIATTQSHPQHFQYIKNAEKLLQLGRSMKAMWNPPYWLVFCLATIISGAPICFFVYYMFRDTDLRCNGNRFSRHLFGKWKKEGHYTNEFMTMSTVKWERMCEKCNKTFIIHTNGYTPKKNEMGVVGKLKEIN